MELATIIAFGIGFFAGGLTIGAFAYINGKDWGEPRGGERDGYNPPKYQTRRPTAPPKVDPHEDIDYADIPAFLRRQAD